MDIYVADATTLMDIAQTPTCLDQLETHFGWSVMLALSSYRQRVVDINLCWYPTTCTAPDVTERRSALKV